MTDQPGHKEARSWAQSCKKQQHRAQSSQPEKRNLSILRNIQRVNLRKWTHSNCLTDTPSSSNGRRSSTPRSSPKVDAVGAVLSTPRIDEIAAQNQLQVDSPRGQSDIVTLGQTIALLPVVRDALRITELSTPTPKSSPCSKRWTRPARRNCSNTRSRLGRTRRST